MGNGLVVGSGSGSELAVEVKVLGMAMENGAVA